MAALVASDISARKLRYLIRHALRLLRPRRLDAPLLRGGCLSRGFAQLAIPIQFAILVDAVDQDHPAKAAKLRDIDGVRWHRAILGSLAHIVYPRPAQREIELWRVVKDARELRCIALYLPTGIDLRLMERRGLPAYATAQRRPGRAGAG